MRSIVQKTKAALVFMLVVAMLSISALAEFDAAVLSKKMKVYFAPTTSSEQIGTLKQGTVVSIEAHKGNWARINYKGRIGFAKIQDMVSEKYEVGTTKCTTEICYITRSNTNPRWGALSKGIKVYIRGKKGNKLLVSNKDMTVLGYVPAKDIRY